MGPYTNDSERVAGLLAGSSEAKDLGEKLRDLRQFHGLFRNDHYRPYAGTCSPSNACPG